MDEKEYSGRVRKGDGEGRKEMGGKLSGKGEEEKY